MTDDEMKPGAQDAPGLRLGKITGVSYEVYPDGRVKVSDAMVALIRNNHAREIALQKFLRTTHDFAYEQLTANQLEIDDVWNSVLADLEVSIAARAGWRCDLASGCIIPPPSKPKET